MLILEKLILDGSIIHLHGLIALLGFLINIDIESALVMSHEVDDIYVCAVHILKDSLLGVHADTHCLVDAHGLHAVAWLHEVDEVLIHTQVHSVGGLALGDGLWRLLHLDMLLVREVARVVCQLEGVAELAVIAGVWLQHAAARDELSFNKAALVALEGCLFHLRDDIGVSDDNTLD